MLQMKANNMILVQRVDVTLVYDELVRISWNKRINIIYGKRGYQVGQKSLSKVLRVRMNATGNLGYIKKGVATPTYCVLDHFEVYLGRQIFRICLRLG